MRVQLKGAGRRDERGAVAIVVGLLIIPMMLLSAFTLDYGMAYAQAQSFASGADSAALAIVSAKRQHINDNPSVPTSCDTIRLSDAGEALTIAKHQADANAPYQLTSAAGQVDVQVQLKCVDKNGADDPNGNLVAKVTVQRNVPTTLGRMAGVTSVTASRNASAALGVAQKVNGLFPLALCDLQADAIVANATAAKTAGLPYPIEKIEGGKVWSADCSAGNNGSGNWGWLDCGDGLNAPAIGGYIANGCKADLTLQGTPPQVTINGAPGNKINSANISGPFDAVLGRTYALPVYDKITGTGATTQYRIIGFIQLKLISYTKDGDLYVQYVNYSPVGDINSLCGIGSITCNAYNAWAIGLTN
ncbi:TadE/TadG family type IV pilus assembly protein [Nostocoides sp. Soil756]|uniref:TadE/TadG family type IV pilus assembly protein n=1 Tax=Nostocoides sp. Soil756 TaxID=1736399 RepID=UPI000AD75436|nr:TadE/TadG family type IV pilus assembly protein [Tetrasphaera sp. Soil756]